MKNLKRGLSLAELLAVVVIMGILAVIAIILISNAIENTRAKAISADASSYLDALSLYCISNPDELLCNLSEGDTIYIADETGTEPVNYDLINYVSKDYSTSYETGYIEYLSDNNCYKVYLDSGDNSITYLGNGTSDISDTILLTNFDSLATEDGKIVVYTDGKKLVVIPEGEDNIVNNNFSTDATDITFQDCNIMFSDELAIDEDQPIDSITIIDSKINELDSASVDTLIFEGACESYGKNWESGQTITDSSIEIAEINNIYFNDDSIFYDYSSALGKIISSDDDTIVNLINTNTNFEESYARKALLGYGNNGGGVYIASGNDGCNITISDNSLVDIYCDKSILNVSVSDSAILLLCTNREVFVNSITDNGILAVRKNYKVYYDADQSDDTKDAVELKEVYITSNDYDLYDSSSFNTAKDTYNLQ